MHGYFADDLLLIVPSTPAAEGLCLFGEVLGEHKGALAMALTTQCRGTQEITIDLTGVHYLANSALEILVALAKNLQPPQRLLIRAASELALRERLTARGWDGIETLRLTEGQAHGRSE
ncbi:STAS domain-containing protein [Streptomyces sp. NBC_01283]|uniref:STAS domain-containing protein n=1 Tax=Streptomyces sp. NBC_01283 TaxID=2903812 RepID=UPI00352EF5BB|nr:STAS domain-containing protein [Streptomyces sp. NBC_01283]